MIGAFVVSSALAGLSGFMLAPIAQASLYMGLAVGLKGFSAAMIFGVVIGTYSSIYVSSTILVYMNLRRSELSTTN
jgi:preprotein translocase subunit SecF